MDTITFIDDEGQEIELFVIMDTKVNGITYILVTEDDPEDEDAEYFILREAGEDGEMGLYEPIEDDGEYESVQKIFEELYEDA